MTMCAGGESRNYLCFYICVDWNEEKLMVDGKWKFRWTRVKCLVASLARFSYLDTA